MSSHSQLDQLDQLYQRDQRGQWDRSDQLGQRNRSMRSTRSIRSSMYNVGYKTALHFDVNSVGNKISNNNSTLIRTKVGSVEVSRKMVSENALVGFEENGGFMYGKHNYVRDGGMTLALMLELLSNTDDTLSNEIANLPQSFTTKDKIPCSNDDVNNIITHLLDEFPKSDTTDGLKIVIDEKNWVMIRPSGTEPIVRIYAESDTQTNLDSLIAEYIEKIKAIISR